MYQQEAKVKIKQKRIGKKILIDPKDNQINNIEDLVNFTERGKYI